MDQKFSAQFSRLIYLMYFNSNLFIKICKKCIYLIATFFFCVKKEKKGKLEKSSANRQPSHLATCLLDYASHTHCGHPTQRTYGKKKTRSRFKSLLETFCSCNCRSRWLGLLAREHRYSLQVRRKNKQVKNKQIQYQNI